MPLPHRRGSFIPAIRLVLARRRVTRDLSPEAAALSALGRVHARTHSK